MIHSYTALSNWRLCPRLHHEQHVLKRVPFVETEAMREGKRMHKAIEDAFNAGAAFPEPVGKESKAPGLFELVRRFGGSAEMKIAMTRDGRGCNFFDERAWVRGVVDLYLSAHKQGAAVLVDWKSGNPRYTDTFQAEVYAAILRACVPATERVMFIWSYPDKGVDKPVTVDASEAFKSVTRTAQKVEADETHSPRPCWKCRFCPVTWCEFNEA